MECDEGKRTGAERGRGGNGVKNLKVRGAVVWCGSVSSNSLWDVLV